VCVQLEVIGGGMTTDPAVSVERSGASANTLGMTARHDRRLRRVAVPATVRTTLLHYNDTQYTTSSPALLTAPHSACKCNAAELMHLPMNSINFVFYFIYLFIYSFVCLFVCLFIYYLLFIYFKLQGS